VRILVATDQWYPDAVGGSAYVASATAQLLAERGHEVKVVSPRTRGEPPVERSGTFELHRRLRRTPLPQTFADPVDSWRFGRHWQTWPEVVVAHQATVAAGMLAASVGAPLAYVFHASAPLEQRFRRKHLSPMDRVANLALHPSLVLLDRVGVRRAAAVFVLSNFSAELLVRAHPSVRDRVHLVRVGVDIERFQDSKHPAADVRSRLGIPMDRPFILTVRRLEPRMGIDQLLHACSLLAQRGTAPTLGIAGSGESRDELQRLVSRLGIQEFVRFFGRVADDELPALYWTADLFVLPTLAYEGLGISTVEALAAGTPVVGTTVGATPEILRPLDERLLVPPGDPEALASAIEENLSRSLTDLGARCAAYAREQFSWSHAIESWELSLATLLE
jgi:glycosyltransferase involved in cell wall biosynthesis